MRKLIWAGIILGLSPLITGSACGGYDGWPFLSTSGADAKVTQEISVSGTPLQSGLWTFYVNYNNLAGPPSMKSVSTYRDGTAPFGVFTTDGNLQQHFNDHVGVITSAAFDTDRDGHILFGTDYDILAGFCPAEGGTGSPSASAGFKAYCDKGDWAVLVASSFGEETKQTVPGSKFGNGTGSPFSAVTAGQILASSTPIGKKSSGLTTTINAISLPGGASKTLATPISANVYGFGHAIAIDASQAGLKEAAGWLATQWAGKADRPVSVSLSFNGGAATANISIAGGNSASIILQHYAAQ